MNKYHTTVYNDPQDEPEYKRRLRARIVGAMQHSCLGLLPTAERKFVFSVSLKGRLSNEELRKLTEVQFKLFNLKQAA
jgi:hypothetical protein